MSLCEDKEWYVLRIKYGQSQVVADAMIEDGIYVYLAKVWKDIRNKETGKKQRKLLPFMNLLFNQVHHAVYQFITNLNNLLNPVSYMTKKVQEKRGE